MFTIFICSFAGGFIRGLAGFIKHQFSYKNVEFRFSYFLGTTIISGLVGTAAAIAVKELGVTLLGQFTPALGFIVGYAGGDFIENIYKIIVKKSSLFEK